MARSETPLAAAQPRTRTRREYVPLDDGDLTVEVAPSDLLGTLAPKRDRDAFQQKIDATVATTLKAWHSSAEGERDFKALLGKNLVALYRVAPEKVATVKAKIRSAGVLNEASIKFGDGGKLDDNGRELVAFAVMEKGERKTRSDKKSE